MLRWDDNNFCHLQVVNKTQQVTDYENNNKNSQNPQTQKKSVRRKCWGHLNHKFF